MTTIVLPIEKEIHERYLRSLFHENKEKFPVISTTKSLGQFIVNRIEYSQLPTKVKLGTTLVIPNRIDVKIELKFICFSERTINFINNEIDCEMKREFREYIIVGQSMGMKIKEIIHLFLREKNIPITYFEMFKKFDYRRRVRIEKKLVEMIKESGFQVIKKKN